MNHQGTRVSVTCSDKQEVVHKHLRQFCLNTLYLLKAAADGLFFSVNQCHSYYLGDTVDELAKGWYLSILLTGQGERCLMDRWNTSWKRGPLQL